MKGILMKPWKAQAIAESSPSFEWQTRSLSGLKEINKEPDAWRIYKSTDGEYWVAHRDRDMHQKYIKPRFKVGDIAYIKEVHFAFGRWAQFTEKGKTHWEFFKDWETPVQFIPSPLWSKPARTVISTEQGWYKRSPLFLPAEAARHFIKITGVRYERLQSITEEDAMAEGCWVGKPNSLPWYRSLWDSINPKHPWARNEWVEVDSFVKWEKPI